MSWYASYYIGERKKNGKIYPLMNFDEKGDFYPVFTRSRSYASDLYYKTIPLNREDMSDELKKFFKEESGSDYRYMDVEDLGSSEYTKRGYFLISDVMEYLNNPDDFTGFYDVLDPVIYTAKASNELAFGAPKHQEDEEGNDITPHSASEYMYFSYPDYQCEEYEVSMLKDAINTYRNESLRGMEEYKNPIHYVVLVSAG